MSDVALASTLIRESVHVDAGATIARRVMLTARKLGWSYTRTNDIWRRQARRIDAFEMDQLRAAKIANQIQEARRAYAELTDLIASMEASLDHIDPDFYRPDVADLRNSRGATTEGMGAVARSRIDGELE